MEVVLYGSYIVVVLKVLGSAVNIIYRKHQLLVHTRLELQNKTFNKLRVQCVSNGLCSVILLPLSELSDKQHTHRVGLREIVQIRQIGAADQDFYFTSGQMAEASIKYC